MRLACVQNGHYTEARRRLAGGGPETYRGQRYTIGAFERLVAEEPHLVVSLDAPPHHVADGAGEYLAVHSPAPSRLIPRRFTERAKARAVIRELEHFAPTHLLLRCNDVIGCELLAWAIRRGIPSAVIIAARFRADHPPCLRFCALANDPLVAFVANHNRVVTNNLLECGLSDEKALMWDYPPDPNPADHQIKTMRPGKPLELVYAGWVAKLKGVTDVVDACALLHRQGQPVRLDLFGEGPALDALRAHRGRREGWLHVPGVTAHDQVLARMRQAHAVVVPSRHAFPEALPCVIQEALALRTPVILSDHPIFREYFREGEAARFFRSGNPRSLAGVLTQLASHPELYADLSRKTAEVWNSFQIPTKFHHLLERLRREWIPREGKLVAAMAPRELLSL